MIVDWIARLIDGLLKRYGGLELLQLFLLFFTLESAGLGLAALVTWLDPGFMFLLTAAALSAAWALSRARLNGWAYALTGAALGALVLPLTAGRIGGAILGLLRRTPTAPSNINSRLAGHRRNIHQPRHAARGLVARTAARARPPPTRWSSRWSGACSPGCSCSGRCGGHASAPQP